MSKFIESLQYTVNCDPLHKNHMVNLNLCSTIEKQIKDTTYRIVFRFAGNETVTWKFDEESTLNMEYNRIKVKVLM